MSDDRTTLGDYLAKHDFVQALLAIDLGNSRTGVVVVDQVNERGHEAKIHARIPLDGRDEFKDSQAGPFDSLVACTIDDDSFIRIGGHARQITRAFDGKTGEKFLSSPKRYYFDDAPSRVRWLAGKRKDQKNDFESAPLSGVLAGGLAARFGCEETDRLPRAGLLGGMVVELYAQAMRYMNGAAFKKLTSDPRPRFISHVHVTHPTTLTSDERARYVLQIDKALRVYSALRAASEAPFIGVRSDVDEAIAVLGHFAEREIGRAGGNVPAWLSTIGRYDAGVGYTARVAVIDIGGGTTDLTIADIVADGAAKANIIQLFLDGVNSAGDDVIAEVIKTVLFKKVATVIIGTAGGVTPDQLKARYNGFVGDNPGIIAILVSVAVKALLCLNKAGNDSRVAADIRLAETAEDRAMFVKLRKEIIDGDPVDGWAEGLKISISEEDMDNLRACLEIVLSRVLEDMGREIAAFECDLMVISGKITSIKVVHELLAEYVALPPWAIVNMNDAAGGSEDVKYATVRGGAQAAMHALGVANASCHTEFFVGRDLSSGYDWGCTPNPRIQNLRISKEMGTELVEADGYVIVPYVNATVYLLRQRRGGWGTVAVSHEITKRDLHKPVVGTVFIKLSVKNERVAIVEVTGGYDKVDFECRVHGFAGGKHWMDHGVLE